jgi:hypothetical protein
MIELTKTTKRLVPEDILVQRGAWTELPVALPREDEVCLRCSEYLPAPSRLIRDVFNDQNQEN